MLVPLLAAWLDKTGGAEAVCAAPRQPSARSASAAAVTLRIGVDEPRGIGQRPAVLAGRDIGPYLPADRGQARQILRGDRLLQPADADRAELVGAPDRLAGGVAAVGVHVKLGVRADHLAGEFGPREIAPLARAPRFTDLDLDPGNALLLHPLAELLPGARVVIAGEAAAAVHRHVLAGQAEQAGQRLTEQPGLQVPQGDVHRRDGHRRHARAAAI